MFGIAESVVGVAGKVLDKFVEDKDLKTKLTAALQQHQEDMGTVTGPAIAGTGDDNTVHTRRKKKKITPAKRRDLTGRIELIKGMAKKWQKKSK